MTSALKKVKNIGSDYFDELIERIMAKEQYEVFNRRRLAEEAEDESLADDEELKRITGIMKDQEGKPE
jgi:hypothetical protein